ncbi:MAG TPA: FAD-binding oxidoreductase [Acetobacteraceae bacterium]|jgi:D-amino-acid dehydrogenase|nr:FAD-binding oxidoreductase [Acetobacteraceae bacterium]
MSQASLNEPKQRAFVLGGGIVGACCAFALLRRGYDVTLIDKDAPGHAASFGNSASIGLASVPPLGMPGMLRDLPRMLLDPMHPLVIRWRHLPQTLPWLLRFRRTLAPDRVEAIAGARAALLSQASTAYDGLLSELGRPDLIRHTGLIFAYESRDAFVASRGGIALRRRYGIEARELDGPALREMEPALSERVVCGVHYPIVQTVINPLALTEAIADAVRARGGRVLRETVRGFETGAAGGSGEVTQIVTDAGRHASDLVVIAAGAWSRALAALLGETVMLVAERGYHIMMDSAPNMPTIPVVSGDRSVSIVTLSTGLRMTTMAELTTIDAPPDHARALRIFQGAAGLIRGLELNVATKWFGSRPSTPDSLPVIGRSPRHRNVIYAFGHGHLGVTFGAVTGAIVGTLARDERPNFDITPYRPDRQFDGSHLLPRPAA